MREQSIKLSNPSGYSQCPNDSNEFEHFESGGLYGVSDELITVDHCNRWH